MALSLPDPFGFNNRYNTTLQRLETELEIFIHEIGALAAQEAKAALERGVYDHPPIRDKKGRVRYRRTGRLRRGEQGPTYGRRGDVLWTKIQNNVRYAVPRHEMGKPGKKRTQYPAHWHDEAAAKVRKQAVALGQRVIVRTFGRGQ